MTADRNEKRGNQGRKKEGKVEPPDGVIIWVWVSFQLEGPGRGRKERKEEEERGKESHGN